MLKNREREVISTGKAPEYLRVGGSSIESDECAVGGVPHSPRGLGDARLDPFDCSANVHQGTVFGPLVGAAVFTLLPEVLRASQHWRYVIFAAGIIVLMALRPQGMITGAQIRRLFDWRSPGRRNLAENREGGA